MKLSKSVSATLLGFSLAIMPGAAMAQKTPPPAAKSEAVRPPPPIQLAPAPPPFETRGPGIPPPAPPAYTRPAPLADTEPKQEHFDLFDALNESIDQDLVLQRGIEAMRGELATDPNIRILEAQSPGMVDEMVEALTPIITNQTKTVQEQSRPRVVALLATYLTTEEATEISEFFRSDIGRRMMKLMSGNVSFDAIMEDATSNPEITRDQLERDAADTVASTIEQLSPEELAELGRAAMETPAMLKFNAIRNEVRTLQLEIENSAVTPEIEAQMIEAIESVIERRFQI